MPWIPSAWATMVHVWGAYPMRRWGTPREGADIRFTGEVLVGTSDPNYGCRPPGYSESVAHPKSIPFITPPPPSAGPEHQPIARVLIHGIALSGSLLPQVNSRLPGDPRIRPDATDLVQRQYGAIAHPVVRAPFAISTLNQHGFSIRLVKVLVGVDRLGLNSHGACRSSLMAVGLID